MNPEQGSREPEKNPVEKKERKIMPPPPPFIKKAPSPQETATRQAAEARQIQQLKESIPESKAEKREQMIEKILKEGGLYVKAWLPSSAVPEVKGAKFRAYNPLSENFLQKKGDGFIPMTEAAKQIGTGSQDLFSERRVLEEHHINELIDIRPVKESIRETIVTPAKKGFLGFGSEPEKRRTVSTNRTRSLSHREIVKDGKQEPAIQFSYIVAAKQNYRDTERPKKALTASFVLPESTAAEFQKALEEDPTIMRDLIEQTMKQKFLKDASLWERGVDGATALRPPYEEWDTEPNGGRVYIQKEGDKPGWREENVRNVKK